MCIRDRFKGDSLTFVAGSSWGPDEDIFIKYFNEHPEMKLVIAPHAVSYTHLAQFTVTIRFQQQGKMCELGHGIRPAESPVQQDMQRLSLIHIYSG